MATIMAASAVRTNRIGSSMVYVDETYNESKERAQKRIKQYQEAQQARTSNYCNVSSYVL